MRGRQTVMPNTTLVLGILKTDWQSQLLVSKEEENKQRIVAFNYKFQRSKHLSLLTIMSDKVIVRCSWTQVAGNELSQLVPTRLSDEDVYVK